MLMDAPSDSERIIKRNMRRDAWINDRVHEMLRAVPVNRLGDWERKFVQGMPVGVYFSDKQFAVALRIIAYKSGKFYGAGQKGVLEWLQRMAAKEIP